jgi:hypothetical protein
MERCREIIMIIRDHISLCCLPDPTSLKTFFIIHIVLSEHDSKPTNLSVFRR